MPPRSALYRSLVVDSTFKQSDEVNIAQLILLLACCEGCGLYIGSRCCFHLRMCTVLTDCMCTERISHIIL